MKTKTEDCGEQNHLLFRASIIITNWVSAQCSIAPKFETKQMICCSISVILQWHRVSHSNCLSVCIWKAVVSVVYPSVVLFSPSFYALLSNVFKVLGGWVDGWRECMCGVMVESRTHEILKSLLGKSSSSAYVALISGWLSLFLL